MENGAKNDEAGWGTWQGGGCNCVNGQFCCDDTAKVPINKAHDIDLTVSDAINPVDYFTFLNGVCSCNAPNTLLPSRDERTDPNIWDPIRKGRTAQGRRSTKVLVPRAHSPSWNQYAPSGLSSYQNWQAKTGEDRAPWCTFEDNYNLNTPTRSKPPSRPLQPLFTEMGIGIGPDYYTEIATWPKGDWEATNADFANIFSPVDGVIIAYGNSKQNDPTKPKSPDPWSEIVWRIGTKFCVTVTPGTTDFSGLNYVFQYNIDNLETNEILEEALAGVPIGQAMYWTPEDTSLDNAFWPLLGSQNGIGMIFILTDHKVALKGK